MQAKLFFFASKKFVPFNFSLHKPIEHVYFVCKLTLWICSFKNKVFSELICNFLLQINADYMLFLKEAILRVNMQQKLPKKLSRA